MQDSVQMGVPGQMTRIGPIFRPFRALLLHLSLGCRLFHLDDLEGGVRSRSGVWNMRSSEFFSKNVFCLQKYDVT